MGQSDQFLRVDSKVKMGKNSKIKEAVVQLTKELVASGIIPEKYSGSVSFNFLHGSASKKIIIKSVVDIEK